MRYFRPKSFLTLILVGFSLVSLPLAAVLGTAAIGVHELARSGARALYRAVHATQDIRILAEQITSMERNARQFQVLGDDALLRRYMEVHLGFHESLNKLADLSLDQSQQQTLSVLSEKEHALFDALRTRPIDAQESQYNIAGFGVLSSMAQSLLHDSYKLIDREVAALGEGASRSQEPMFWLALTVIPLTLLVGGLFTVLITRPISQINQAIQNLGDGEFSTPISVEGPRDIERLGERLNWLRIRLCEVEENKDRFLRHISHELKTPLAAMREGTELLAEQVVGPLQGQQLEVARILRDSSLRLQRLIENLLHYYRAAYERKAFTLAKAVAMDDLVKKVLEGHQIVIMAKQLDIQTNLESVSVPGDPQKLEAVVSNLVSNAVKFSPAKGHIRISLRRINRDAVLDLEDCGPGIQRSERKRIFEAFFQGETRHDGYVGGTGLGLAIAKEYVSSHNGAIEVVETDGTAGAWFRVTLPAV